MDSTYLKLNASGKMRSARRCLCLRLEGGEINEKLRKFFEKNEILQCCCTSNSAAVCAHMSRCLGLLLWSRNFTFKF